MNDLGLATECKGGATPGVSEKEEEGGAELGEVDERRPRAAAATANYLARKRVDIQFAANEINRFTSKPEPGRLEESKETREVPEGQKLRVGL